MDHDSGLVTVTNIVPEPPQVTKRIDPANYVDPHCNICQRKLDTRQITTAFQSHMKGAWRSVIRQNTAAALGTHRAKRKKRHGSKKYGFVGPSTLAPSH